MQLHKSLHNPHSGRQNKTKQKTIDDDKRDSVQIGANTESGREEKREEERRKRGGKVFPLRLTRWPGGASSKG